jgi:hypothetical protein
MPPWKTTEIAIAISAFVVPMVSATSAPKIRKTREPTSAQYAGRIDALPRRARWGTKCSASSSPSRPVS